MWATSSMAACRYLSGKSLKVDYSWLAVAYAGGIGNHWLSSCPGVNGSLSLDGGRVHVLGEPQSWLTKSVPVAGPVAWPRWKTEGTAKFPGEQPDPCCWRWWESPLAVVGEGVLPLVLSVEDVRQILFLCVVG